MIAIPTFAITAHPGGPHRLVTRDAAGVVRSQPCTLEPGLVVWTPPRPGGAS